MYRIQAYNYKRKFSTVYECQTMEERDAQINAWIESGEYGRAGISWEWLARK